MGAQEIGGPIAIGVRLYGYEVFTLSTYSTPYYFVRELGSVAHTPRIASLKTAVRRAIASGRLADLHAAPYAEVAL